MSEESQEKAACQEEVKVEQAPAESSVKAEENNGNLVWVYYPYIMMWVISTSKIKSLL